MKNFIILLLLLGGAVTLNSCQKEEDNWLKNCCSIIMAELRLKKSIKMLPLFRIRLFRSNAAFLRLRTVLINMPRTFGLTVRSATVIPLKDTRLIKLVLMKFIKSRWERRHPG